MATIAIEGGTVLTMNGRFEVVHGPVLVRDGTIQSVGAPYDGRVDRVIDAGGTLVLPGFVQTHVHLCQTLFRGLADDRPLLEWLKDRVWPLESAHTPRTLGASARLAVAELLATGTTTVLTMETVHDTDAVCEAVEGTGLRAVIGKCLMDAPSDAPPRLYEPTRRAIDESLALRARWHGAGNGRLRTAFAPRFALSCTRDLLAEIAARSAADNLIVHTHASEQQAEIAIVQRLTGQRNIEYFESLGLASDRLCVAHCVWVDERERQILAERGAHVLHCPSSNLKLGSGIAPVTDLRARGVSVSLGADGAACSNRLDMFDEMRLAALLQAVTAGPGSLTARDVVAMATRDGARALGLQQEIGSIEAGKRADLIVVDVSRPHVQPSPDPYSALVYAARGMDVRLAMVDGEILVDQHALTRLDRDEIAADARAAARELIARAGL